MFKVKLDKQLIDQTAKEKEDFHGLQAIKEVKLLMDADSSEDLRILKGLGNGNSLIVAHMAKGRQMELEKLEDNFDGAVFTMDKIKALALDYNLRFLPTTYFKGNLDIQVIAKIKEFSKKTNTEINDACLDRKFYILAPQELFNMNTEVVLRKKPLFAFPDPDPIMFYKIDDTHWKMLHKWGSDFTIFRLISGFVNKSFFNKFITRTSITFVFLMAFVATFFNTTNVYENPVLTGILCAIISAIGGFISMVYALDDWNVEERFFTPGKWNNSNNAVRG